MWRVLVLVALVSLAAYGAVWLADNPETIAVTWAGREYSLPLSVGVVLLVAAALLLSFALGAFRFLATLPATLRRAAARRRRRKGRHAVSRGLVAIGAGDLTAARRHAGDAQRLIGSEPLVLLLAAQSAQASGDRDGADAAFRAMTERSETRVLGLRGLYLEARRREDPIAAREHAEEAAKAAPAVAWANEAVLDALSAEGDWAGATRLIERRTSLGLVDRDASRRQRAVLLAADALAREGSDPTGALAAAESAVKLAPGLVPSAVLAGRLHARNGDTKKAARIIEAAWAIEPHPELAGAYLNLRPGDSALDRLKRAEALARLSSWSDESRLAIARAAIEARELPRAREAIAPLLSGDARPSVRVCLAAAEIEGRSGNAGGSREWLARAARAPRDKAWIADGVVSDSWAPISPVTGRLDAFRWETPPDLLGGPAEFDLSRFEPDEAPHEELPAFLGRGEPPGPALAPTTIEPEAVPREDPKAEAPGTVDAQAVQPTPDPVPLSEPPRSEMAGPTASSASPPSADPAAPVARLSPRSDPEPVIFPVRQAPDDPGPAGEEERRRRLRIRV